MTMHDDAMRTIVDLSDSQLRALDRLTKRLGISRAEAIRRAVDVYARECQGTEQQAFGIWHDQKIDGLAYEDSMRGDWKRE